MTNEQLVARIKAGDDVAANMGQLYMQVKAFIHTVAVRYQSMAELEDLEQEGYLALYPAVDGYDPAQGVKFLMYAGQHIKQRMHRYAWKSGTGLSYHGWENVGKYRRLCSAYELEHGREPSDWEASCALNLPVEKVQEVKQDEKRRHTGSLDSLLKDDDGLTFGETIPSAEKLEEEATDRMHQEELRSLLWPVVDALPGRQPEVIRMKYQNGMNAAEIAGRLHADVEAVRQEERKAMQGLRRSQEARRLKTFLPEFIEAQAYHGSGVERFRQTWTSSTERAALMLGG